MSDARHKPIYAFPLAACLLLPCACAPAWAAITSTTTLTVSPASVTWPSPITLTANVTPVTPGLVSFCNAIAPKCQGPALLGQAQLTANGTASIKLVLGIGAHSLKAVRPNQTNLVGSSSNPVNVTVAGLYPTTTSVIASANSPYTLTATVSGHGPVAPTGNISFNDRSNSNYPLGTTALSPGTTSSLFLPEPFAENGRNPSLSAVADFNNDGSPDVALVNNTVDAQTTLYTLAVFLSAGSTGFGVQHTVYLPAALQNPTGIVTGDFNNDGNPDLAVSFENANQILIFLNDGQGGFIATGNPAYTGSAPAGIAAGDFNGDGNADLVTTDRGSSTVTMLLGDGAGNFTAIPQTSGTGLFPGTPAVGDFNNDGIQDLAIAGYYSTNLTILLGKGDGTFTAAASPGTGIYPVSVAAGDFNGDGNRDLAVVNQFSQSVTILIGAGNGTFTLASQSPVTGNYPSSVALADFNADGIEDLAVANVNDGTVTMLFGKGDGTFPTTKTAVIGGGTQPYSIAAADFNGDGRQDVAVAATGKNTLMIMLNTLATTATASATIIVPGGGSHSVTAGYGGDATYAASTTSTLLAGTVVATTTALQVEPSGTAGVGQTAHLTASVSPAVLGGLTASGVISFYNGANLLAQVPLTNGVALYKDMLSAAGKQVLSATYSGDANFGASASGTSILTIVAPTPSSTSLTVSSPSVSKGTIVTLTAAVVDSGKPVTQGSVTFCNAAVKLCEDAAVLGKAQLTSTGTASIKLALPGGSNSIKAVFIGTAVAMASTSAPQSVAVAGPLASTTTLATTGAAGNYTFSSAVTGSWPGLFGKVSFLDTSNNNLVLGSQPLFGSTPKFTQLSAMQTGGNPESVTVGDFNRDGKQDIAIANQTGNSITVLLGTGAGTFTANAAAVPSTANLNGPSTLVTGDFNADGKLDLAIANYYLNDVTILLGNGDGTFSVKSSASTGASPVGIAMGDFNGDGKLDLAVISQRSNTVTVLIGGGDGTFLPDAVTVPTGSFPAAIATADLNGDGKLDLAVANLGSGTVTILLGGGDGSFTPAPSAAVGANPAQLVIADFNGDGAPDIAVANLRQGTITILLNNGPGSGTFTVSGSTFAGNGPLGIAATDVNADGITDLMVTDFYGAGLTLLLGKGDGTFSSQAIPMPGNAAPSAIAVADFNQDGGPDFTITDANGNTASVLLTSLVGTVAQSGISVPGAGTHQVQAVYSPTATPYAASTSALVAVTATPIPTVVFVGAAPSLIVTAGSTITLNCAVSPVMADNFTLSGTVSMYNGSTLVGTASLTNGKASFTSTLGAVGSYTFTANYSGSPNFAASTLVSTVHVVPASATSLSLSANSSTAGTPVTMTATVTSGGKNVTRGFVTFCDATAVTCNNSAVLGTASLNASGSASLKQIFGIGSHSIKAVYSPTMTAAGSGSASKVLVVSGLYPTTTTLSDAVVSGAYSFTAKVVGSNTQAPTGSVSFMDTTTNATLGTAALTLGSTTLSFNVAPTISTGVGPETVAVGDFNGDGKPDLAITTSPSGSQHPGTVTILRGIGDATFKTLFIATVGTDPRGIAVGDFNGDGNMDIAIANFGSSNVTLLLGDGTGNFVTKSSTVVGALPLAIVAADFNGDGKADLAIPSAGSNTVTILLGNGDGTFATAKRFPSVSGLQATSPATVITVGDFNQDGTPDLVVINSLLRNATILLGNGDGTFTHTGTVATGMQPAVIVAQDFNKDGKLDLAIANYGDKIMTVALGTGDGTFATPTTFPLPSDSPHSMVAGDFNGDGKLDLALTFYEEAYPAAVLLGNGDGTFAAQPALLTGSFLTSMATADFNGDGKPDLVTTNFIGSNAAVLLNGLNTSATATLSGLKLSGTGNQNIVTKYPASTVYAASTSNTLSLAPLP